MIKKKNFTSNIYVKTTMEKQVRGKRASENQKEFLINYLEGNMDIANDKFITVDGAKFRDSKWKELAVKLNAIRGTQKDGARWKKFWTDLRLNTRGKYNAIKQEEQKSGINGMRAAKNLSQLEERIIKITTAETLNGDSTLEMGFDPNESLADEISVESSDTLNASIEADPTGSNVVKIRSPNTATVATNSNIVTVTISSATSPKSSTLGAGTAAAAARTLKAGERKRKAPELTKTYLEKFFKIEDQKLKELKLGNALKKEQIEVMKEQIEAIKKQTEAIKAVCQN